jgi:hypothetical protein
MEELIARFLDFIKGVFQFIFTGIVSTFLPMKEAFFILLVGFTVNYITGFVTDIRVNNASFSMKKSFDAIIQMCYYFGLMFFLSAVSVNLHESILSDYGVRWFSVIVSYSYVINILKNGKQLLPGNKAVELLYDIVTIQGIGYFRNLFNLKKKNEQTNN